MPVPAPLQSISEHVQYVSESVNQAFDPSRLLSPLLSVPRAANCCDSSRANGGEGMSQSAGRDEQAQLEWFLTFCQDLMKALRNDLRQDIRLALQEHRRSQFHESQVVHGSPPKHDNDSQLEERPEREQTVASDSSALESISEHPPLVDVVDKEEPDNAKSVSSDMWRTDSDRRVEARDKVLRMSPTATPLSLAEEDEQERAYSNSKRVGMMKASPSKSRNTFSSSAALSRQSQNSVAARQILNDSWEDDFERIQSRFLSRQRMTPRTKLAQIVTGKYFVNVVSIAIFVNTVFIGYEINDRMRRALHNETDGNPVSRVISLCFTVFFTAEIIVRLIALRASFWCSEDRKWNIFDFVLVAVGIAQETFEGGNFNFVRTLRIFRIIRIARILRLLRAVRELRMMVLAIGNSLLSLSWAFVLLLVIMYVVSILLMQGAVGFLEDKGMDNGNSKEIENYYSSIGRTILSLIEAISGGDWTLMADALAKQSEGYRIAWIFYVVFVVFGVLNVLTGVFCSDASHHKDRDLIVHAEAEHRRMFIEQMTAILQELDKDESGNVTWSEFEEYMKDHRLQAYFTSQDLDSTDARLLFKLLDHNDTEEIKTMDFIVGCFKLKGTSKSMQIKKLSKDLRTLEKSMHNQFKLLETHIRDGFSDITSPRPPARLLSTSTTTAGSFATTSAGSLAKHKAGKSVSLADAEPSTQRVDVSRVASPLASPVVASQEPTKTPLTQGEHAIVRTAVRKDVTKDDNAETENRIISKAMRPQSITSVNTSPPRATGSKRPPPMELNGKTVLHDLAAAIAKAEAPTPDSSRDGSTKATPTPPKKVPPLSKLGASDWDNRCQSGNQSAESAKSLDSTRSIEVIAKARAARSMREAASAKEEEEPEVYSDEFQTHHRFKKEIPVILQSSANKEQEEEELHRRQYQSWGTIMKADSEDEIFSSRVKLPMDLKS